LKEEFSCLVSYIRFVELQQKTVLSLVLFLKTCYMGNCTGISFIDSTALKVCHIKRELPTAHLTMWQPRVKQPEGGSLALISCILSLTTRTKLSALSLLQGKVDKRHPLLMESYLYMSGKAICRQRICLTETCRDTLCGEDSLCGKNEK
jgi:hypothetical protein